MFAISSMVVLVSPQILLMCRWQKWRWWLGPTSRPNLKHLFVVFGIYLTHRNIVNMLWVKRFLVGVKTQWFVIGRPND